MTTLQKFTCGAGALLACTTAMAHEGHGMSGMHWHASDVAGLVLVAVLAGAALWLARGK